LKKPWFFLVKFGIEPHILDHHSTYYIIILHHVVWCTSSHYNIMLNHHTSLQLPQEIVVPMMARKSECVSQTLWITNKFTHEKKFSCTYPRVCQWGHSFLHPFLCWVLVIIHSLEHARDSKQNANTKQRNIPSLNIWSKMQIPNNGTFQAWTFEAKCKILNNDLYWSMVWTKGTYRVLRVVHSLEERAPPAFARNLLKSTMWWCKEMSNKRITLWRAQNLKSIKSVSEGAGLCLPQTILITAWSTKLHDQIAHAIHIEECPYNIKWKKVPEPHPQCLKAAPKKPRLYSKKQHSSTSVKGGMHTNTKKFNVCEW
jgi:hypothetical protein